MMQLVLTNRFPLVMIDESQDTNAALIDALFTTERRHQGKFALGLFGDMMQRIYGDGKHDLGQSLPSDWEKPAKPVNHRSAKRVVRLGNALRSRVDRQVQTSPDGKAEGHVRLFLARPAAQSKSVVERTIRDHMADITSDSYWREQAHVSALALEHHMAANRLGFGDMWHALYPEDHLKRGLIDGDLPGIRIFAERVWPIVQSAAQGDRFKVAEILKEYSPLLAREQLATAEDQRAQLARAKGAVEALCRTVEARADVTFREVLGCVAEHGLFEIPEALHPFVEGDSEKLIVGDESDKDRDVFQAWRAFLDCTFGQIERYDQYVSDDESFDTHHGVKGLEFKRVVVLLDDSEARGFMYSYNKLLGVEPPSASDVKNEQEGKDSTIARTRRLLYVACTRAVDGLAVLVYTDRPAKVRDHVVAEGWFAADEIVSLAEA